MIKTIVFDIGRVLIGFEWDEYGESLFDVETAAAVKSATFGGPHWKEQDRGVLDTERIHNDMVDIAPHYETEIRTALDRVGECTTRKSYAIPWIESLKAQGYQVLYLSNYSDFVRGKSTHALDFLDYMDGGVFSYKEKCIKPDREIYEILFRRYDLDPTACVFIDDSEPNIVAARELGMKGIVFENYEQAAKELAEMLAK